MAQKPNVKNVSSKGKTKNAIVAKKPASKAKVSVIKKGKSTTYKLTGRVEPVKMSAQEERKALEALARKNTKSRSAVKRYPRYNGKVIELAPAPKFAAKQKRTRPSPEKPPTAAELRANKAKLAKEINVLKRREQETREYQAQVAIANAEREAERTHQAKPAPAKLKVRIKTSDLPKPVAGRPKVIVLRANGYRRPCGPVPKQFQGAYTATPEMYYKDGKPFPPPMYTDATPLPNLSIACTSWLSERANADLERMLKDMRGLSQRCMIEINDMAKSGRYKTAPFPEIRRRLILSLTQELRENL